MDHTKQLIRIAILNACSKHVRAWVDHYDAGEDGKFLSLSLSTWAQRPKSL